VIPSFPLPLFSEDPTDHVAAHPRAGALEPGEGEVAGIGVHRGGDQGGLCAARRLDLARAFLEFSIGPPDDAQEVVQPRQEIVVPVVPPIRTAAERFIVVVL
jgi:hypothetical protein